MTLLLCAEAGDGPAAGGPESCSEVGDGPAAGGSESCGEVGDRPKPATVLLQKRNEKLKVEDTGMADGTRLTDGGTADLQEGILRMNKSQKPPLEYYRRLTCESDADVLLREGFWLLFILRMPSWRSAVPPSVRRVPSAIPVSSTFSFSFLFCRSTVAGFGLSPTSPQDSDPPAAGPSPTSLQDSGPPAAGPSPASAQRSKVITTTKVAKRGFTVYLDIMRG